MNPLLDKLIRAGLLRSQSVTYAMRKEINATIRKKKVPVQGS